MLNEDKIIVKLVDHVLRSNNFSVLTIMKCNLQTTHYNKIILYLLNVIKIIMLYLGTGQLKFLTTLSP